MYETLWFGFVPPVSKKYTLYLINHCTYNINNTNNNQCKPMATDARPPLRSVFFFNASCTSILNRMVERTALPNGVEQPGKPAFAGRKRAQTMDVNKESTGCCWLQC